METDLIATRRVHRLAKNATCENCQEKCDQQGKGSDGHLALDVCGNHKKGTMSLRIMQVFCSTNCQL